MKKRVLLLVANNVFSFENPNSAVAVYLKNLRDSLLQDGFEVSLFPAEKAGVIVAGHVEKKSPPVKLKRLFRKVFPGLYAGLLARKQFHLANMAMQQACAGWKQFDLVIEFLTLGSTAGAALKQKFGVPLVVIYDSPLALQFAEMHGTASFMEKKIEAAERVSVREADAVLCYSAPVKKYLEQAHQKKTGIHVLPCIVWKAIPEPAAAKKQVIGFVGSFLKWHKVELLVRAFEQLVADFPEATLLLIGYGQEWEKIKTLADQSPVSSKITMTGFVSEEELNRIKSQLLIGVMPGSNWYGSPLKLFEYAESGIAVVAAHTPTVADLFSADEVVFIDPENETESLYMALKSLLEDDSQRNRLITNARNKMLGVYSKSQQLYTFNQLIKNTIQSGIKE